MTTTRTTTYLEPDPLAIQIERMQQAGYDERRINAAIADAAGLRHGWTARLRAYFARPATQ
jgi:hypothetical protein